MEKITDILNTLDTPAKRLRYILDQRGIKASQCARGAKVNPDVISAILHNRRDNTKYIFKIAEFLGCSAKWLLTGEGAWELTITSGENEGKIKFDKERPLIQTWVPIISWQEAGKDIFIAADVKNYKERSHIQRHTNCSIDSFTIIMEGDSMASNSPDRTSFLDGYELHFEPIEPHETIEPGSYILARERHADTAIFRRLLLDCGQRILVPNNPNYPMINLTQDYNLFGLLVYVGVSKFK